MRVHTILIDKKGYLSLRRSDGLWPREQWCPYASVQERCGDWCPKFQEPEQTYPEGPAKIALQLCDQYIISAQDLIDERK